MIVKLKSLRRKVSEKKRDCNNALSRQREGRLAESRPFSFLQWDGLFARDDSVVGTNLGARATFDAGVGIDVVDFALRDSFYGANGLAGATCYA